MDIRDGTKETNSHWTWNKDTFGKQKPIILVDYNHTITKKCLGCEDGLAGDGIQEGAVDALRLLSNTFRIIIFTGNLEYVENAPKFQRSVRDIKNNLTKHGIPFDDVLQIKPPACFIIDDRAIHHKSWRETGEEITRRMKCTSARK